jgi:peptidoglycan/LPS O-acetylase OafA/YrhL
VSAAAPRAGEWRSNNFDLIRLCAALQVLIVHADSMLHNKGPLMGLIDRALRLFPGVPIFFIVSGFLISRSYENALDVGDYYRNRCLRIYPALWVCLIVSVGVVLAGGLDGLARASSSEWLIWWAAQMSLFQGYPAPFLQPPGTRLNGSLWTIPVELQFYLILPTLYALCGRPVRRSNALLGIVLLSSLAFHFAALEGKPWFQLEGGVFVLDTVVPYLWMFLIGVLIQRNWSSLRRLFVDRVHWWLIGYTAVCAIGILLHRGVGSADIGAVFFLPLAGLVISAAMSYRTLSERLLRRNDVSYGVYIYHVPGVYLLTRLTVMAPPLAAAVLILVTLAVAMLSWRLVERPFLAQKRRSLRAPRAQRAGSSQPMLGVTP